MKNNYNKMHNTQELKGKTDPELQAVVPNEGNKLPKSMVVINCTRLNIRAKNDKLSSVLYTVNRGDKLEVIDVLTNWVKVKVKDVEGFVMKEFVEEV